MAIATVILAAIFMLQNSHETTVKFFFWTVDVQMIFGLLFAFGLGLIIGLIGPRLRHD